MNIQDYIKPELLILIPVLYLIGSGLKKSELKDKWIPLVLGGIGVVLSGAWVFATGEFSGWQSVLTALFTAITQGVLAAGASVYVNQVIVQSKKED